MIESQTTQKIPQTTQKMDVVCFMGMKKEW